MYPLTEKQCAAPEPIENGGYIPTGYTIGSQATIYCEGNYVPDSNNPIRCKSGGKHGDPYWFPKPSFCEGIDNLQVSYIRTFLIEKTMY